MSQYDQYAYHCDDVKTDTSELLGHMRGTLYRVVVPNSILVVGNPGSGKTTFCNRLNKIIKTPIVEHRGQQDEEIIETLRTTKAEGVVWIIDASKDRALNRFQDAFKQAPQHFGRKLMFFFTHVDKTPEAQVWMLNHMNETEPYSCRLYYAPLTQNEDPLADYNALMPVKHIYDLMAARA
jgi:predicted GTPase